MLRLPIRSTSYYLRNAFRSVSNLDSNVRLLSTQSALKEKSTKSDVGYEKGGVYHGFVCQDVQYVKEFNMTALVFRHEKTETEYLHLQRDDPNNVFSINFRTTPFNSTGLPHILEHTVLCGSEKYPVRDPFFKMLNRSLATFMNAMTGPDYTFYPFSSQNEVDYRNLQKIYLDAVFKPNLNTLDFLQEGWRLEHSDVNDPNSDLIFKGVVFNEMKGAFSENGALFGQHFLNTILPSHTYGYVSGGDPLKIPDLTVKELRDFHGRYYHPSNCKIYSYGNFPLEWNLEICDRLYLQNYEGIDSSHSRVPPQPRWNDPVEKSVICRHDKLGAPIEKQNQIAIGYLMSDITNVYDTFVLQVLTQLMIKGPNSAFYKSLIEPNISGGYNELTGYDSQIKDTMFVVGLQDLETNSFQKVKEIFDDTINKIVNDGFKEDHIESILHKIELSIKHQSTNFGLNTLFNLTALWNHDGNLGEALQVGNILNKFKENLRDPGYLQGMVKKYFNSNNHKLTMTMTPDEEYENNLSKQEADLLKRIVSNLGKEDKDRIFKEGLQLAESQKAHQNIDLLPCLTLADISKDTAKTNLKKTNFGTIPTQICIANTNDVTYFKALLNTSNLDDDLKYLIPIFNSTVAKMGTKKYNYRDFDQLINLKTGGVGFSSHVGDHVNAEGKYEEGVYVSSHCLDQNIDGMISVLSEIFNKPTYEDVERFKMLFDAYVSSLTPGIAGSGHLYAMQCANSLITKSNLLRERLSGMKHIEFIKNMNKNNSTEEIIDKVSSISDYVLDGSKMRMAVNMSSNDEKTIASAIENFANNLEKRNTNRNDSIVFSNDEYIGRDINSVHHVANFAVNFCSKSVLTAPFAHEDYPKLRVLSKFLSAKYLHPVVREQNGAYGGGARVSNNGLFTFYSYRDPNSRVTLDVFDNVFEWLKSCPRDTFDDQSLFESKLSVLQQLDAPIAECNKGADEFLHGLSGEVLARHRSDVLDVTKEDLYGVCDKYLSEKTCTTYGKCVVGPGEADGKLTSKDGEKWKVIKPEIEE